MGLLFRRRQIWASCLEGSAGGENWKVTLTTKTKTEDEAEDDGRSGHRTKPATPNLLCYGSIYRAPSSLREGWGPESDASTIRPAIEPSLSLGGCWGRSGRSLDEPSFHIPGL